MSAKLPFADIFLASFKDLYLVERWGLPVVEESVTLSLDSVSSR